MEQIEKHQEQDDDTRAILQKEMKMHPLLEWQIKKKLYQKSKLPMFSNQKGQMLQPKSH